MKKRLLTQKIKIKDLGKVITGTTPPTANKGYFGGQYLFIKPSDISEDQRYVFKTEMTLSGAGYEYQQLKALPKNSICIVCIGTIGKKMCLTSQTCFTNQQLNSIVVNESKYDPLYIYYLMRMYVPYLEQLNAGSTSGRENVNKSSFQNIEIQVHELQTQPKIAFILSAYDDLIENNTRRIKILEEMAQTLYHEWFVKFRFPGYEQVKMVESGLGLIPEGWKRSKIKDLPIQIIDGDRSKKYPKASEFQKEGVLFLNTKNIVDNKLDFSEANFITIEKFSQISKGRLQPFDIVMTTRGSIGKITLFNCKYLTGIINAQMLILRADNQCIYQLFLFYLMCSHDFQEYIRGFSSGSAQPQIPIQDLRQIEIIYPAIELQIKFSDFTYNINQFIKNIQHKNETLRQTRDLLLPKLISGEIDVENLDIDNLDIAA